MVETPAFFADLLKQHRAAARLTQEDLAELAGLSARTISDLERGITHRPYAHTVERLVKVLGLTEQEVARFRETARRVDASRDARPAQEAVLGFNIQSAQRPCFPIQPTPFIGRQQEVEALGALLRREEVRLLTLTGPGGVGKTRLALRVAERLGEDFPDGTAFVSLGALTDPALVASAIATGVGITERSGQPILEALIERLQAKRLLLVLDTFEHLLPAAGILSRLLASCAQLTILVTSRAVLHLAAEHEYPLLPFPVPTPRHLPELDALARYDAVQLFLQRARAVKPGFEMTEENAAAIAEICCRLDGLPLAIELAAARIRLFSARALLERLADRLQLLTGGPRDAPERHQTLRQTIAWSYCLLPPAEQRLFARLSVFTGGWTLAAAGAVCNPNRELDLLATITSLVEQSLLRQEGDEEPRFRMLDTIREYAIERLEAQGEAKVMRRQHAQYVLSLSEEAGAALRGPSREAWLQRLDREHDNARAALNWFLERGDTEAALRLATGLAAFWTTRGYRTEGLRWLSLTLAHEGTDRSLRAEALGEAARLAWFHGDYRRAISLSEEQLALVRDLGDRWRLARVLRDFGVLLQHHKNLVRATALFEESLVLFRELGDVGGIARALSGLGTVAKDRGDYDDATRLLEESLNIYRQLQDADGLYWTLMSLGFTASAQGNYERAAELIEESARVSRKPHNASSLLALAGVAAERGQDERARALLHESLGLYQEVEDVGGMVSALNLLARLALRQRECELAKSLYREALTRLREVEHARATAESVEGIACVLAATGKAEQAVRLFAAATRLRRVENIAPTSPREAQWAEVYLAMARDVLDTQTRERAWEEGWTLTLQHAVESALGETS